MEQGSKYVVTQYLVSLIPHKPKTPTTAPRWSIKHVPSPLCKIQMVINFETLPQESASCNYWALSLKPCKLREKFTVFLFNQNWNVVLHDNTWGNEITCQDRQFCRRRWVLGLWSKQVVHWYVTRHKQGPYPSYRPCHECKIECWSYYSLQNLHEDHGKKISFSDSPNFMNLEHQNQFVKFMQKSGWSK
jgi:hypothetical protein